MSGYFDALEAELRGAVPRAAAAPAPAGAGAGGARRSRGRPRIRPRLATLGLAVGVAVPLVVAVLAVGLLGHRQGPLRPGASARTAPKATTLAQLKANFAVLRRPQTAADRSWRPSYGASPPHEIRKLERLARRLPGGGRVFLTVQRAAGRGYSLALWVVVPDGDATGASFSPADHYLVLPVPASSAARQAGTPWVSVVPDGVSAVLWTFQCRHRPCSGVSPTDADAAVRDNVAVATIRRTSGCAGSGCRRPTRAVWFGSDGRIVSTFSATTRVPSPPFVAPLGGRITLAGDSIAGVRFGSARVAAVTKLEGILGVPVLSPSAALCGVNQVSWPVVIDPIDGSLRRAQDTTLFFRRDRLVGYQYGGTVGHPRAPGRSPRYGALTGRGLTLGDPLSQGRRLYGAAFAVSSAQGGTWSVRTPQGRLDGYASGHPAHGDVSWRSTIESIDAGDVGCPAMSP